MINIPQKSPVKDLADALDATMRPLPMLEVSSPPAKDHDKEMVLNRLRSINRMSQILEQLACGCEPMPSWAEAKVYSAAKDLQGILGYLLGEKPL